MDSIRKNNAPIGGVFGWGDDSVGSDMPFNRGGFRDFGGVGSPTLLPNKEPIAYKDVNLPKGLTGLLGIGGNGQKGDSEGFDYLNTPSGNMPNPSERVWRALNPTTDPALAGADISVLTPSPLNPFGKYWHDSPFTKDAYDNPSLAPIMKFKDKWGDEIGAGFKWMMTGFNPAYGATQGVKQLVQMVTPGHSDFNLDMFNKLPPQAQDAFRKGNPQEIMKWVSLIAGNLGRG